MRTARKLLIVLTLILLSMSAEPDGLALAATSESSENGSVPTALSQWIQSATLGDGGVRSALAEFFEDSL